MVNRFEAIGISVSVLAMAVALFLLRVDNFAFSPDATEADEQAAALVVADPNNPQSVKDALLEGSSGKGQLERLIIDDVILGVGDSAEEGDTVTVNYIGTLQNGQEFDNSYTRGEPFTFTLGEGRVIKGWEQGLVGMKVGGQRILVVPAHLGYGDEGFGPIPAKATLVYAVELETIK